MSKKRNARRRTRNVLLIVSMMLVVAMASIGGTLAWLTASTTEIVNTFSASDIEITLTESKKPDGTALGSDAWVGKMVPGEKYAKDPKVTVTSKTDVDVYLFVEFTATDATYISYTSNLTEANGWYKLTGVSGVDNVWYRTVTASNTDQSWYLLAGEGTEKYQNGFVQVSTDVTKLNMTDAAKAKLTYKAYAIQQAGSNNASEAWTKLSGN